MDHNVASTVVSHGSVDLYLHIRVLISIILGLSVTRLISGIASLIQHPERYKIWPVHLVWVAWVLLDVLTFWWFEFRLSTVQHWTFGLYAFICLYASMYYFLSALLFPQDLADYKGYQDYFLSRRHWFFSFVALTELLDVVDTLIKGEERLRALGPEYIGRIAAFVLLCAVGASTRNTKVHALLAVGGIVYEMSFVTRYFFTMD